MAVSKVDICNLALVDLGHDTIMSLDEDSREAAVCNAKIDHVIDAVAAGNNWNCALEEAELAPLTEAVSQKYSYSYRPPVNCIRVVKIQDYRPGSNYVLRGHILCTDEEAPVSCLYVKKMSSDMSCMDPLMVAAVAARLSAEICYKLAGSRSAAESFLALYATKVREAKDQNAIADDEEYQEEEVNTWLTARD